MQGRTMTWLNAWVTRSLLLPESEPIRGFLHMLSHIQLMWLRTCRFATLSV